MCNLVKMFKFSIIILRLLTASASDLSFPAGFKFGAATSAHQVEGAWNVSDKSESVWDRFTIAHPEKMFAGSNASIAADSYHLWRRDVEIAEELGLDFYRFSLSWPRLLPNGFPSKISEDGTRYYNDLINALLEKGIEPVVTMNHFDIPQTLQDLGGWSNPLIADWYSQYARVLFTLFGDRVKRWITLNEPLIYCSGYTLDMLPPEVVNMDFGYYLCVKHSLLAHASAYHIYDQEFRSKYNGKVSVDELLFWLEPSSPKVNALTELAREYFLALFFDPIFSKDGGYPPKVEEVIANLSKSEGLFSSRLPALTEQEKEYIRGTADFMSINYYSSRLVLELQPGDFAPYPMLGAPHIGVKLSWDLEDSKFKRPASVWIRIYPEGFRKLLRWLQNRYGNVEIFIAENGFSTEGDLIDDYARIECLNAHLEQVLLAVKEDGINVTAFTVWSLIDTFDWVDSYRVNIGLYQVDFNSSARTRTPRLSAKYYADVIASRALDVRGLTCGAADVCGAYSPGLQDEL